MKLDLRYGNHPDDVRRYDTADLRKHFLVKKVFSPGERNLTTPTSIASSSAEPARRTCGWR